MTHRIKSKLSKMSARGKKLLLLRIYMYALASCNKKLLSYFGKMKHSRKGRKKRGPKLHGKEKAAFLRRMAKGRRKSKR